MKKPELNTLLTTQKRLLILIVSITFLFLALFFRLGYLQIIQGKELQSKAVDQWTRDLPLKAERGKLLDINGEVLADNHSSYSVYVRANAADDINSVVSVLSAGLDMPQETIRQKLSGKPVSDVTIKKQVDKATIDTIKASKVKGIYFSIDNERNYPYGEFLGQVLGYTNIDGDGQAGLEAYYNKYLKGVDGKALTETDIKGSELEDNFTSYIPSIPGMDVKLTIDINIQMLAETAVKDAMKEFNSKSASAIIMNAKTGAIAGMATTPGYNLNSPPRDNVQILNELSKNKMIVDVFEPGSTFKIFTTAAAIEEGKTHINDKFFDPGYRLIDGERIKCWRTIGHGNQTLTEGVNNSCNCVFMDLAQRLGTETYYKYLNNFGLTATTNIDFFSESRGILMPKKEVRIVDLARMGFGQAIAVTPLQLVAGVAAVVNGGNLMQPYFVSEIRSRDGQVAYINNPLKVRKVLSDQTSATMRQILEDVVRIGSGKKCAVPGYRIGGKTGTAQKYENGIIARGKYVSSFIGFAPADDPEYVTLVVVDEPTGYVYYGSLVAAPFARDIFEGIFIYKKMKAVNAEGEAAAQIPTIVMPDLEGQSVVGALTELSKYPLQCEIAGENGKVIFQTPAPGTLVTKNSIILIRLES